MNQTCPCTVVEFSFRGNCEGCQNFHKTKKVGIPVACQKPKEKAGVKEVTPDKRIIDSDLCDDC